MDVEETVFRIYHGHFEFFMMAFSLTNAPSAFEALMNEVFHPYPREFVLFFFFTIYSFVVVYRLTIYTIFEWFFPYYNKIFCFLRKLNVCLLNLRFLIMAIKF